MPRTTAPLLSFGARGQIAKTLVYSTWKGVPYSRQYVVPANPRTVKQTANRTIWQLLGQMWLYAPAPVLDAFNTFAIGKPLMGRNQFFKNNQALLATDPTATDLTGFVFSPGARGGLPPAGVVVTPDNGELGLAITLPDVPSGWTLDAGIAAAVQNQDPLDPFAGEFIAVRNTATPNAITLTGLTNGTEYALGVFLEWTKPDGLKAYSISVADTGTPAA